MANDGLRMCAMVLKSQQSHSTVRDLAKFCDGVDKKLVYTIFLVNDRDTKSKCRKLEELTVRIGGFSLTDPAIAAKKCYLSRVEDSLLLLYLGQYTVGTTDRIVQLTISNAEAWLCFGILE